MISDANILITDENMKSVYDKSNLSNVHILSPKSVYNTNMFCTSDEINVIESKLKNHFYLIAGSSNFHHLDIANISRIFSVTKKKIQLILFDQHLDCQQFDDRSNLVHCGNWVSYLYRKGIIGKVFIVGATSKKDKYFDKQLGDSSDFSICQDINSSIQPGFFDDEIPTYISIDTDILSQQNDWPKGALSLNDVLGSPIWNQISNYNIVGSCILGHVTDNRRAMDFLKVLFKKRAYVKNTFSLSEIWDNTLKVLLIKIQASLSGKPLSLPKQLNIIKSFYNKVQSIRNAKTAKKATNN